MSQKSYDDDEVEFAGVITIESDTVVIADPTKKISSGVVIRGFGGSGVFPVFVIRDSTGRIVGATINFDIDTNLDETDDELDF
jgi:hypothetical protein